MLLFFLFFFFGLYEVCYMPFTLRLIKLQLYFALQENYGDAADESACRTGQSENTRIFLAVQCRFRVIVSIHWYTTCVLRF